MTIPEQAVEAAGETLPERLRKYRTHHDLMTPCSVAEMCDEAARAIEASLMGVERASVTPELRQRLEWALTVYRHSRVQHEAKIHNVLLECSDVLLGPQPLVAEERGQAGEAVTLTVKTMRGEP